MSVQLPQFKLNLNAQLGLRQGCRWLLCTAWNATRCWLLIAMVMGMVLVGWCGVMGVCGSWKWVHNIPVLKAAILVLLRVLNAGGDIVRHSVSTKGQPRVSPHA